MIRCTERNDQNPYPTNFVSDKVIKQSLFFFRFSEWSAHARERRAAKPRDARSEGGSRRTTEKRETARSLAVSENMFLHSLVVSALIELSHD